jgi:hypothetical protein
LAFLFILGVAVHEAGRVTGGSSKAGFSAISATLVLIVVAMLV